MAKETDERSTPFELFQPLNDIFRFTLDPCATAENAKCPMYFTLADDGLAQGWSDHIVFCNPPYSRSELIKWIRKAGESSRALSVLILPGDISTKAFYLAAASSTFMYFPSKRFKFGGNEQGAKFGTIIAVWWKFRGVPYGNDVAKIGKAFPGTLIWGKTVQ